MIKVLLWLPLAAGLLACVGPLAAPAGWRARARSPRSAWRSGWSSDFDSGAAGLQHTVDEAWIPDLGVRY